MFVSAFYIRTSQSSSGHTDAIAELSRARELAASLPDPLSEANIMVRLASALTSVERAGEAIALIEPAWQVLRESGSVQYQADVLTAWGEAAEQLGDFDSARDRLQHASQLYLDAGTPHAQHVRQALDRVESQLVDRPARS